MADIVKNLEYLTRIPLLLYYLTASILLFSGVSKIIDPLPTTETIKAAFKFSDEINLAMAAALPFFEAALVIQYGE